MRSASSSPNDPSPLFVIGLPRSGTSLLYLVLNQHTKISLMYECNVWDFPNALSSLRFRGDWLSRLDFFGQTLRRHRLGLNGECDGLGDVDAVNVLYRKAAEGKKAAYIGEKSPVYCSRLRQLARRYPNARFILIWRDPVETYRSVLDAGRTSRYFRKRGQLTRLIGAQEAMIQQATELKRASFPVHHVSYPELVDNTETTCRRICDFLNLPFEPRMMNISAADCSAINDSPHQAHLRQGRIQRRQTSSLIVDAGKVGRLRRFGSRWNRLLREKFNLTRVSPETTEPGPVELRVWKCAGALQDFSHSLKRVIFEFAPLSWLENYRRFAGRARTGQKQPARLDLSRQLAKNWPYLAAGALALATVMWMDYITGTQITVAPFYFIPCAIVTLACDRRWGTLAAMASAIGWGALQNASPGTPVDRVTAWNTLMQFLLLEIPVLLLARGLVGSGGASETLDDELMNLPDPEPVAAPAVARSQTAPRPASNREPRMATAEQAVAIERQASFVGK